MRQLLILFIAFPVLSYAKTSDIFKKVPFSSQFIEDGALIRNINFDAVKEYIPMLESKYNLKLQSRGEAHITVLTPPEAQGWFTDKKGVNFLISSIELHKKYSQTIQNTRFKIKCIGRQTNKKGDIVFYLVVESKDILNIRKEIELEVKRRAKFSNIKAYFKASDFYPHITIGYKGSDIHGVSKGVDTCIMSIK